VAEGHAHRRVTEFGALGDLAALARDINAIAEQIRNIRTIPEEQELLLRASVERLLNKEGIPAGVVDRSGRIVVTNGALREILQGTECTGRSLIGREEGCPIDVQVTEVQDAGVLRGYLVRAPAPTSTSSAPRAS
jgi:PAS domain-containing protein